MLVGYADGCLTTCIKDASSRMREDNLAMARQTCGKGLFAASDTDPKGPLLSCKKATVAKPVAGVVKAPGATGGSGVVTQRPSPPTLATTGPNGLVAVVAVGLLGLAGTAVLARRRGGPVRG